MGVIQENKLVLFGAGKIGRSFIGQVFSIGGYEVVFIDINKAIIDELNRQRNYNVIIKSGSDEVLNIKNVRGVYANDEQKVVYEISTASILAVSVGLNGLKSIFPLLAMGLLERYKIDRNYALDIIIAENMRNAGAYFRLHLSKVLPGFYSIDNLVGLVETSIGKMVPVVQNKDLQKDILQIFAEPYNTLILNKKGFRNAIPDIKDLAPKENMIAWVDRKFFIHNLGHSAAAYIGHVNNPRFIYLDEVFSKPGIKNYVRATMLQSADILLKTYPLEFTTEELTDQIDDLLLRFQNVALGDTIYRVGCDLTRKLGPEDRLAGAIKAAVNLKLPYNKILTALVCACHFCATDQDGNKLKKDIEFIRNYEKGIETILIGLCGFDGIQYKKVIREAGKIEDDIKNTGTGFIPKI